MGYKYMYNHVNNAYIYIVLVYIHPLTTKRLEIHYKCLQIDDVCFIFEELIASSGLRFLQGITILQLGV